MTWAALRQIVRSGSESVKTDAQALLRMELERPAGGCSARLQPHAQI